MIDQEVRKQYLKGLGIEGVDVEGELAQNPEKYANNPEELLLLDRHGVDISKVVVYLKATAALAKKTLSIRGLDLASQTDSGRGTAETKETLSIRGLDLASPTDPGTAETKEKVLVPSAIFERTERKPRIRFQ